SLLQATMDVKPGVDRAKAEARFVEGIGRFVREGPSEDELRRAVTSTLSAQIGAVEDDGGVYGKGATLAERDLDAGDPAKFRKDLARMAALTPEEVRETIRRWIDRPAFALAVTPGDRTEKGEEMGGWGDDDAAPPEHPADPREKTPPVA